MGNSRKVPVTSTPRCDSMWYLSVGIRVDDDVRYQPQSLSRSTPCFLLQPQAYKRSGIVLTCFAPLQVEMKLAQQDLSLASNSPEELLRERKESKRAKIIIWTTSSHRKGSNVVRFCPILLRSVVLVGGMREFNVWQHGLNEWASATIKSSPRMLSSIRKDGKVAQTFIMARLERDWGWGLRELKPYAFAKSQLLLGNVSQLESEPWWWRWTPLILYQLTLIANPAI